MVNRRKYCECGSDDSTYPCARCNWLDGRTTGRGRGSAILSELRAAGSASVADIQERTKGDQKQVRGILNKLLLTGRAGYREEEYLRQSGEKSFSHGAEVACLRRVWFLRDR
jgi:hypothetical protein